MNIIPDTNVAVYTLGSRATGKAKAYSDIDLVVDYDKTKLQMEKIAKKFRSVIINDLVRLV
jgi:predicted nucleotidyltransferase